MPTLPRLTSPQSSPTGVFLPHVGPPQETAAKTGSQRLRIWQIAAIFHCSIIGTCLTAGELRQLLGKAGQRDAARQATTPRGRGARLAGLAHFLAAIAGGNGACGKV